MIADEAQAFMNAVDRIALHGGWVDEMFVNPNDNIVAALLFYAAVRAPIGEEEPFDEKF